MRRGLPLAPRRAELPTTDHADSPSARPSILSLSLCPVLGSFAPSRVRPTFTYLRTSGLRGEDNNCQFVPCHALSMPRQHSVFLQGISLLFSCFGLLVRSLTGKATSCFSFHAQSIVANRIFQKMCVETRRQQKYIQQKNIQVSFCNFPL